ncbi:hypothetical protein CHLRE_12g516851v5 [Chlamydomonas reinhardtii]|uniref:Uncharacterized protein n=1 Tax=Chlamydomonas reinhardtii TaxID=3055 RepID=A0A2K3D3W0_CHLRE|nr:uncharacterized protein CHLRE_12g516851v5 [Chlamydomonas reinhardtii]PNW75199.1 hypothetical protein CHLRE_12g516851v5 [Chlamydomonas reinhardtii]
MPGSFSLARAGAGAGGGDACLGGVRKKPQSTRLRSGPASQNSWMMSRRQPPPCCDSSGDRDASSCCTSRSSYE